MHKDWNKFINASLLKHFDTLKQGKVLLPEGVKPQLTPNLQDWAELRVNGPDYSESTKGQWSVDLSIDIACNALVTDSNGYLIHETVGIFQEACIAVPVYLFSGDPPTLDTDEPFFCLRRLEQVSTRQWGIVKKDVDVYCASVAASYQGEFTWPLLT